MRITLVTDTWHEQINGVVRTLDRTAQGLRERGHSVTVIHPGMFRTLPLPSYPEIRLSYDLWRLGRMIEASEPECLHIAVEGPLGVAAKLWADRRDLRYTTSYHTQFPEYLQSHYGTGLSLGYRALRWFHGRSSAVLANTPTMMDTLRQRGFRNLEIWGRGVDTTLFRPDGRKHPAFDFPRPILLNVGRVSAEKNLPAFYETDCPGSKVQIGDGPMLATYRRKYPDVHFLGARAGNELAACYRSADLFVFPSRTDTFGLVLLEAIASGLPVAAFPVVGPKDVLTPGLNGVLKSDLASAIAGALLLRDNAGLIRRSALRRSWEACTTQFEHQLVRLRGD